MTLRIPEEPKQPVPAALPVEKCVSALILEADSQAWPAAALMRPGQQRASGSDLSVRSSFAICFSVVG